MTMYVVKTDELNPNTYKGKNETARTAIKSTK
jgi:hypothetical protein